MIEILPFLLAVLLGILAGTFTGLAPGIHINLVATFLTSSTLLAFLGGIPPLALAAFVASMAIAHSFLDLIPSIYLGAPEEDSFLAVLPGHELLLKGKGHEAVVLTLYGSMFALLVILLFTPIFLLFLPIIQEKIQNIIPYLLLFISFTIIFCSNKPQTALIIFALSGFLGELTFSLPIKEPLLPLLTGLFGTSALLISIKQKVSLPKQTTHSLKQIPIINKEVFKGALTSVLVAPLCSFLPGIGSGHAATLGSELVPQTRKSFLVLLGAINTIILGLSFTALFAIEKTRTGAAAAVDILLPQKELSSLVYLLLAMALASIISFYLGVSLSKLFAKNINKINYSKLSIAILILLFTLVALLSNFQGILVLLTGTAIGVFCISSNVQRINLMGCLLVPTILYYLV